MKEKNYNHISSSGLNLIKTHEQCRLRAYLCPANRLTIGYGHVILPKFDNVLFGRMSYDMLSRLVDECQKRHVVTKDAALVLTINRAQAEELLQKDTLQLVNYLNSVTPVYLSQNQFDALCSLIFNIGKGAYAASTLRKKLHDEDYAGAAAEFGKWSWGTVNGKKQQLPGLITRRAAERALFETP